MSTSTVDHATRVIVPSPTPGRPDLYDGPIGNVHDHLLPGPYTAVLPATGQRLPLTVTDHAPAATPIAFDPAAALTALAGHEDAEHYATLDHEADDVHLASAVADMLADAESMGITLHPRITIGFDTDTTGGRTLVTITRTGNHRGIGLADGFVEWPDLGDRDATGHAYLVSVLEHITRDAAACLTDLADLTGFTL